MDYTVGIIGCGRMGYKRAEALKKFPQAKLVAVADSNLSSALNLAGTYGCASAVSDWPQIMLDERINTVLVCTTNDLLAPITLDAIKKGKNVLVEKPAARNLEELAEVISEYEKSGRQNCVKVGFNHRFHPSFSKAKEIIAAENIGDIMFIRARYGHGGRLGYEKEWRSQPEISGGGELLDQGVHVIDLGKYMLGDFSKVSGQCYTMFWKSPVEDNCFALIETPKGQVLDLHVSTTQWKNIFSMEIFCKTGQLNIDGLGGSYGKETLTFYKMKPEMGPPEKQVFEWDSPDPTWELEFADFLNAVEQKREPNGSLYDARAALAVVKKIYESGTRRLNI
jgi:predicted dehydrogenase